jgi:hypothetical protein
VSDFATDKTSNDFSTASELMHITILQMYIVVLIRVSTRNGGLSRKISMDLQVENKINGYL